MRSRCTTRSSATAAKGAFRPRRYRRKWCAALAASRETTNPAALDAFALAIIADGEAPAYRGLARPAANLAAARDNAVPNAGSYDSENNYFNASWQLAYWARTIRACEPPRAWPRDRRSQARRKPKG
jgi:hypothetical protein